MRDVAGLLPQCPRSLNYDLFLAVREARDQDTDYILSLEQSSSGRIVLNDVGNCNTSPLAFRRICALHLRRNELYTQPFKDSVAVRLYTFCKIGGI